MNMLPARPPLIGSEGKRPTRHVNMMIPDALHDLLIERQQAHKARTGEYLGIGALCARIVAAELETWGA